MQEENSSCGEEESEWDEEDGQGARACFKTKSAVGPEGMELAWGFAVSKQCWRVSRHRKGRQDRFGGSQSTRDERPTTAGDVHMG